MKKLILLNLFFSLFSLQAMGAMTAGYTYRRSDYSSTADSNPYPNNWIYVNPAIEKRYLKENKRFPIGLKDLKEASDLIRKYQKSGVFGWLAGNFTDTTSFVNPLDGAKWKYGRSQTAGREINPQNIAILLLWAQRKDDGNLISLLPTEILEPIIRQMVPGYKEHRCYYRLKKADHKLSDQQAKQTAHQMITLKDENYTVWLKPKEFLFLAKNLPGKWWRKWAYSTSGNRYFRSMKISGEKYRFDTGINEYLCKIEKEKQ